MCCLGDSVYNSVYLIGCFEIGFGEGERLKGRVEVLSGDGVFGWPNNPPAPAPRLGKSKNANRGGRLPHQHNRFLFPQAKTENQTPNRKPKAILEPNYMGMICGLICGPGPWSMD